MLSKQNERTLLRFFYTRAKNSWWYKQKHFQIVNDHRIEIYQKGRCSGWKRCVEFNAFLKAHLKALLEKLKKGQWRFCRYWDAIGALWLIWICSTVFVLNCILMTQSFSTLDLIYINRSIFFSFNPKYRSQSKLWNTFRIAYTKRI